jgi:hypothetical protein
MWTPALGVIIGAARSSASLPHAHGTVSVWSAAVRQRIAPSHGVAKRASRVDDNTRVDRKLLPRQLIAAQRASHTAIRILQRSHRSACG